MMNEKIFPLQMLEGFFFRAVCCIILEKNGGEVMTKKIFLLCMSLLLIMQGAALAKEKGLPEEDRIKVAIEITDSSRHKDLGTAQNLELFLVNKL